VPKWLLPTLSEVIALNDPTWTIGTSASASDVKPESSQRSSSRVALQQLRAEREWYAAIAAINVLLQQHLTVPKTPAYAAAQTVAQTLEGNDDQAISGMILSGPTPVFNHPQIVKQFATRTLAATSLDSPNWMPFQLLPAETGTLANDQPLPVLSGDDSLVQFSHGLRRNFDPGTSLFVFVCARSRAASLGGNSPSDFVDDFSPGRSPG